MSHSAFSKGLMRMLFALHEVDFQSHSFELVSYTILHSTLKDANLNGLIFLICS